MKNIYLKFPHHKVYKLENNFCNVKGNKKFYFFIFNSDFLKKYFRIKTNTINESILCLYTNLTEEGQKFFNTYNNYFYLVFIRDENITNYISENILPTMGLNKIPDYFILLETNTIEQDNIIISVNYEFTTKLGLFYSNDNIPISYSPFNNYVININNDKINEEILSFGNEYNFTISFLNNNSIYISPNFNILEDFKKIDEMDRLVNQILGSVSKNVTFIKEYNNYSMLSIYSKHFHTIKTIPHIYSHFSNLLYDNNLLKHKVIGIIYDNISYDSNDQILGAEFLYGNINSISVRGRWHPVPLPGGEIANIEPWRITLATLKESIKGDLKEIDLTFIKNLKNNKENMYIFDAINNGHINYALSSSMHHIIGAFGELLHYENNIYDFDYFEDLLDSKNIEKLSSYYDINISTKDNIYNINTYELFNKVISDLFTGINLDEIIQKLIISIVKNTLKMINNISKDTNEKKVILAGELFKHSLFLNLIKKELEDNNYEVFLPKNIPIDDSSISLGQLIYYIFNKKNYTNI